MTRPAAVLLLAVGACRTDFTPPPDAAPETPGPVIGVARARYSWTTDTNVVVTLRNPSGVGIYYRCPSFIIQRYQDGWRDSPTGIGCLAVLGVATVAGGGALEQQLPLTGSYFPVSGWYRLVFNIARDPDYEVLWEVRSRASPAFEVGP